MGVDWKAILRQQRGVSLRQGCSVEALHDAEARLQKGLPGDLKDLLLQTDGFYFEPTFYDHCWSLEELVRRNLAVEDLPARLVACGGDGGGWWYCLAPDGAVVEWALNSSEERPLAPSLAEFWPAELARLRPPGWRASA